MATWGKRKKPDDPPPPTAESRTQEIVLWNDEDGILVSGSADAVRDLVAKFGEVGGTHIAASPVAPADALAVFATGYADGATSSQYVRFTPASERLLQEYGAVPNGRGGFHTFVRGEKGIAGNLEWVATGAGPERALAFQTAAVGLALRTAVKNVEVAVERVEDKVDHVIAMLRSERLGSVLGDRRTLDALVSHMDAGDALTAADWSSVAALGPTITRDLEKLRAHLRTQLEEAESSWRPRQRAKAADELLAEEMLSETLALLLVAEHNFSQWQHLRVHRIADAEPEHLEAAVRQARAAMRDHLDQDQAFLDQFLRAQAKLLEPKAIDVLAPVQRGALSRAEDQLRSLAKEFADQRLLDFAPADRYNRPELRGTIGGIVGDAWGHVPSWKSEEDADPELPDPNDAAGPHDMTGYDFDPEEPD